MDKSKEYQYSGIPTFMKSRYGTIDELSDYLVGVFGVPIDIGTSGRVGARYGPSAIRNSSACYNPQTYFERGGAVDGFQRGAKIALEIPSLLDLGDVPVYPTDWARSLESIEDFTCRVAERAFPLILGGDHSITCPAIKGLLKGLGEREAFSSLGIIHFDSHPDTYDSYITLDDAWHGSPFRKLLDEKIVSGQNMVMIGIRELLDEQEFDYINEQGISLYSMSDVWERGIIPIIEEALAYLGERTDGIYISLDIDALDPAYAPGTGTPVPGGISSREMIQAFNIICEKASRLVGMDVVEVAPNLDPTGRTADLAAFLLHRVLLLNSNWR